MSTDPTTAQAASARIHAVIMAGGGGTRFWPRSRRRCPKQFLRLTGEQTLLQAALDRIEALAGAERTWVITSAEQRDLVLQQLPGVPSGQIVGEPCGRDTAACIGLGAVLIARSDPDAVMVAMPADHVIEPAQEFRRAVLAGCQLAREQANAHVTFGIRPTHAATGYGYIHRGGLTAERQGVRAYRLLRFKEKPDAATAAEYVRSGEYLWNSGIFIWRVRTLLEALGRSQPETRVALERIAGCWEAAERDEVFRREYAGLKRISIDYAVMEGCEEGLVLEAPFRWDDVGSWLALERLHPQDAEGNTVLGGHVGIATRNCLVSGEPGRLIATVGVEDLVIVQDGDAVLVADKRNEAGIKALVDELKRRGLDRFL